MVGAATGPENVFEAGWRFGGFHHTGETGIALNWLGVFVFRDPEAGPTRILYGAWGPGTGALTNVTVVDWTHGGLFGVRLAAARTRAVVGSTAMLVLETAYSFGTYLTWAMVYGDATHGPIGGGQPMAIDESMLIGPLTPEESMGANGTIAGTLVDGAGGDLYFCSPFSVFRAPAMAAPGGSYTPIKYKYEVGGNLEIHFSARDFPLVPIGSMLVLERTVRKDGVGGSQLIRARVIKREHGFRPRAPPRRRRAGRTRRRPSAPALHPRRGRQYLYQHGDRLFSRRDCGARMCARRQRCTATSG